mgnify:CR=1 FL=1
MEKGRRRANRRFNEKEGTLSFFPPYFVNLPLCIRGQRTPIARKLDKSIQQYGHGWSPWLGSELGEQEGQIHKPVAAQVASLFPPAYINKTNKNH